MAYLTTESVHSTYVISGRLCMMTTVCKRYMLNAVTLGIASVNATSNLKY